MSGEREIRDEDLMDSAADSEQAERLHKALRVLRENPSVPGPLKEMAREVLSGRIGMGEAVQTSRYMEAIGGELTKIRKAAEGMTPEEEARSREQAEQWEREQAEKDERERAEREGPKSPPPDTPRRGRRGVA